jgi:uncharacterized protein (DUF849 family)
MLLKACLNGARSADEHPVLPVRLPDLVADATACARLGAGAMHLHPRDGDGRESLDAAVVDATVRRVRAACGVPVGVATGAWVEPDSARRAELVRDWTEPDFASVNLSEPGAVEVMRALLDGGRVGVEAGVWSVEDAERLVASGLAGRVTRVLVEVIGFDAATAPAIATDIDAALDRLGVSSPRLHHGEEEATWPVLVQAIALGRDLRIGLEDTLLRPDGTTAGGNADLVAIAAALRRGRQPSP